jgi:hypothetical protein
VHHVYEIQRDLHLGMNIYEPKFSINYSIYTLFFFFEEKKKLILSKPTYRMNLENFQIFLSCALTKLTQS